MKEVTFQPNIEKKMAMAAEKIKIGDEIHKKIMNTVVGSKVKRNFFTNFNKKKAQEDIDDLDDELFVTTAKVNPMGYKVRRGKSKRAKKRIAEEMNGDLVVVAADYEVEAITNSPRND